MNCVNITMRSIPLFFFIWQINLFIFTLVNNNNQKAYSLFKLNLNEFYIRAMEIISFYTRNNL